MSTVSQTLWLRTLFLIGLSLLFTHELDAMTHSEWRVLPLTSWLEPEMGRLVFVVLHVPLFALVLGWLTSQLPQRVLQGQFWVSVFLVVHAGLHLAFSGQAHYTFEGMLSNTLIFGAAVFGAGYLAGNYWMGRA
ncbi:DUF6713 family protein [Alcanivorax sediminis]|uniref:Uncharacterized protein n=1 Tax=Alcanivorax sediminis TaxID=2663008 RepID=A0A6N7LWY4_9GAMM|nr:DUF6713 family protein [Alcanivorax sediminis]MQX53724.1 hypothetical protein [Alcanivorax sediminis]